MGKVAKILGAMRKVVRPLAMMFVYFCVATVLALLAGTAVIWTKGHLDSDRILDMLSAIHGLPTSKDVTRTQMQEDVPQVDYALVVRKRILISHDIGLRTSALDNAMSDVLQQQLRLDASRAEYTEMLNEFERQLQILRTGASNPALRDIQTLLETLDPDQAKNQFVRMMENGLLDEVVEVLKSMGGDKQKKITPVLADDDEAFYEIIKRMLTGSEGSLINQTQKRVDIIKEQQT